MGLTNASVLTNDGRAVLSFDPDNPSRDATVTVDGTTYTQGSDGLFAGSDGKNDLSKKSYSNKEDVKKFILCDLQIKIYPQIEKIFLNILKMSGFPDIQLNSKIDFNKLYNERKI